MYVVFYKGRDFTSKLPTQSEALLVGKIDSSFDFEADMIGLHAGFQQNIVLNFLESITDNRK